MKTVLYFQPPTQTSAPEKLTGVMEILSKHDIHVQILPERPDRAKMRELVAFWHPLGAIVDCGGLLSDLSPAVFRPLPTVFFNRDPKTLPESACTVCHDQRATAELAARELMTTGYTNFAYVPFARPAPWNEARGTAFRRALALNGHPCAVFSESAGDGPLRVSELTNFLIALPKPCAVFAANDRTAEEVLTAARLAEISVPDALAVLGVDNFERICERTVPQLSSIKPDFRLGGNLAALMLLDLCRLRGRPTNRHQVFGDVRIVRRASTRVLRTHDPQVAAALELIRREACSGLAAARVAALFDCSRRFADIRFRQATGHSILQEIHAVRLERAQQLLRNPNLQLKALADFCGFKNPNSLRKFFLKETGMTMTAWRRQR